MVALETPGAHPTQSLPGWRLASLATMNRLPVTRLWLVSRFVPDVCLASVNPNSAVCPQFTLRQICATLPLSQGWRPNTSHPRMQAISRPDSILFALLQGHVGQHRRAVASTRRLALSPLPGVSCVSRLHRLPPEVLGRRSTGCCARLDIFRYPTEFFVTRRTRGR